jgi:diguanylate cyclase (GGDEF)-like protein
MLLEEIKLNSMLEMKVRERTQKLQDLVNRDAITGLYSRRYLFEMLNLTLNKLNPEENVILFYIDINRYKMIKTMYGNDIGEKVLTEVGVRLSSFDQKGIDMLASYGEDVFILTVKGNYSYEEALQITNKLIYLCSDTYQIEEFDIKVTGNIGISIYPLDASSTEELIKHANIAMAQARVTGYNQAMAFDSCLGKLFLDRNKIEIMLKWVNFDNDFLLYYQPQVSSVDGKLIGFEALIRWKTKTGDFIPPDEFIPIAEKTGTIIPIGYWVMNKAIKQLAEWNSKSTYRPRMAINVSARQLIERNFITELKETMDANHLLPEYLEIEITESIQLEENSEIMGCIQKISDMGISIAIDDFGTGYSSLYYLKNLPVNRIKIAKPLIDRIDQDTYDYTIVKTVIDIGKIRNIHVIAEGVETKEQWEYLKEMECDEIQGFYFAKPMPPEDIYKNWL